MGRLALIDADEIAYKVALKFEQVYYEVRKDDVLKWRYKLKEDSVESIGNRDDLEIIRKIEILEPTGYKELLDRIISEIIANTSSTDIRLFLSGESNFRYDLATLLPYKGTRDDSTKPFYLKLVKDRIRELGGTSFPHLEADDCMSSAQHLHKIKGIHETIICSSDKDLRTVPGLNYNINKKNITTISQEEADYNFFYQILIGDSTDNIPSPYGIGPVGANFHLEGMLGKSSREYYDHIVPYYSKFLNIKGKDGKFKTKWFNKQPIDDILFEVGNLLWMRRTVNEDERWHVDQPTQ